jgi:hypothetical protein
MLDPKTAWAVGGNVFLGMFVVLSATFEPVTAFALSLVVTLAVKN